MRTLLIDLDGTICVPLQGAQRPQCYDDARPVPEVIDAMRQHAAAGTRIVIYTARSMRTYEGNVDSIRRHTLPGIRRWLERHSVPYDEIIVGKPWCGTDGFYVDDRAVRPSEFSTMSTTELDELLRRGAKCVE